MAMLRKTGLTQLKRFKDFISKGGGDISKQLKGDKSVSNTLDKHIAISDTEPNTNMKTDKQLKNLSKKSIINKVNEDLDDEFNEEENISVSDFTEGEVFRYRNKSLDTIMKIVNTEPGEDPWTNFYEITYLDLKRDKVKKLKLDTSGMESIIDIVYSQKILRLATPEEIAKLNIKLDADKYNL